MSRHWLALSARSSLAPFLYQTPTLSSSFLNRRAPFPFRSSYSTSEPSNPDEPAPTTETEANAQHESNIKPSEDPAPKKPAPRPRRSFLQRRAAAVSQASYSGRSRKSKTPSMTRGEKQVFGDLLQQIGAGQNQSFEPEPLDQTEETLEERRLRSKMSSEDRKEMDQISWIFDSVLKDVRKRNQKSEEENQDQDQDQVARHVPAEIDVESLETAALENELSDLDYSNASIVEALQSGQVPMEHAIAAIVHREAAKTEAALQACVDGEKGDNAVLEVCNERIFSMLQLFKDTRKTDADAEADDNATTTPWHSAAADPAASLAELLDLPPAIPAESVVTALYPKLLLAAFRLLNLHFPQSPLIGQFRTTIKSHGRESAVLGASTALYNEMIYYYWRGCQDLRGVISLLQEMEVTGVEPDRRMCGQLAGILNQRLRDLKRHWRGMQRDEKVTREPWWDLAPNRIAVRELLGENGWIRKLETRLQEKEKKAQMSDWDKDLR